MQTMSIYGPKAVAFTGKQAMSPYVATYDPSNQAVEAQLKTFLKEKKLNEQIKDIQFLEMTGISTFQCTPKALKALQSFEGFQSIEPEITLYTQ